MATSTIRTRPLISRLRYEIKQEEITLQALHVTADKIVDDWAKARNAINRRIDGYSVSLATHMSELAECQANYGSSLDRTIFAFEAVINLTKEVIKKLRDKARIELDEFNDVYAKCTGVIFALEQEIERKEEDLDKLVPS